LRLWLAQERLKKLLKYSLKLSFSSSIITEL
jgi:hypothetical protein